MVEAAAPDAPLEQSRVAPTCATSARVTRSWRACRCGRSTPRTARCCRAAFDDAYRALYGRLIPELDVEVLSWGLSLQQPRPSRSRPAGRRRGARPPAAAGRATCSIPRPARRSRSPVYWRRDLAPGATLDGPALIAEDDTTILVPAACQRPGRPARLCLARAQPAVEDRR